LVENIASFVENVYIILMPNVDKIIKIIKILKNKIKKFFIFWKI